MQTCKFLHSGFNQTSRLLVSEIYKKPCCSLVRQSGCILKSLCEHSLLSSSLFRTPGVLAVAFLLLALRHFDADSLVAEWSDSASTLAGVPTLLQPTSPNDAFCIMAWSGVGRTRREGPLGVAADWEQEGDIGREGLRQEGGEEAGAGSAGDSITVEFTTPKTLESQDNFTYRVSLSEESGNGSLLSRCFTLEIKEGN